jgi:hypothetical protein
MDRPGRIVGGRHEFLGFHLIFVTFVFFEPS